MYIIYIYIYRRSNHMTCRLDSFWLWPDVRPAWFAMISITLTAKLNRPAQLWAFLALQPLQSRHFGLTLAPKCA